MRLLSDIVESIRQVCRYEKTVRVDTKALQSVMMIFVLVMLLIDIENFKLGKYIIGGVTLAVAVMSIVLVIVLKYIKKCIQDMSGCCCSIFYIGSYYIN